MSLLKKQTLDREDAKNAKKINHHTKESKIHLENNTFADYEGGAGSKGG